MRSTFLILAAVLGVFLTPSAQAQTYPSPTFNTAKVKQLNIGNVANTGSAIVAHQLTTPPSYGFPAFEFNDLGTSGLTMAQKDTHFAMTVTGNKGAAGNGSYNALITQQYCAGVSTVDYCTGGQFTARATFLPGGPNTGNFTGSNPFVFVPSGMTPGSVVGEEINIDSDSPTPAKQGLRIADLSRANGSGSTISSAIRVLKIPSSPGFTNGLEFNADVAGTDTGFPINGALITGRTTTKRLVHGLDLSLFNGGFSKSAIALPPGGVGAGMRFGADAQGGEVRSDQPAAGGSIIFSNGNIVLQPGDAQVNAVVATPNGHVYLGDLVHLAPKTFSTLPTCNTANKGGMVYISDAPSSPAYNAAAAGGGSTSVPVFCNGTSWTYH